MLKALGSTMAQVTQRMGSGDPADRRLLPNSDRSQRLATRAQRRRQLRTVLYLFVALIAMVPPGAEPTARRPGRSLIAMGI